MRRAYLSQTMVNSSLIGLLVTGLMTACTETIQPPAADTPTAQIAAQPAATDLPPLGAASPVIVANASTPAPDNEAVIDTVEILIQESFPVQVNAVIKGKLPDACVKVERINQQLVGNTFKVVVVTHRQLDVGCIAQLQSFEQVLPLEVAGLPNGTYTVTVSGTNSVSNTFALSAADPLPATATSAPTPAPAGEQTCVDQAAFVADVTIPDNTPLGPGEPFVKTWRIRNIGSCLWGPNYALVLTGGEAMGGPVTVLLPHLVQPGGEIDLSISLVAPTNSGVYRAEWKLQNGSGVVFGSRENYPFHVQIMVGGVIDPPTPATLSINGVVWDDHCQVLENGLLSGNCILDSPGGQMLADGHFNEGEHGIAGVQVKLSVGECPGNDFVFTTTITDPTGSYRFNNLQAGPHCISIDALVEPNASLLLPGVWTHPAPGVGTVTIIIGADQSQPLDFGWDSQ